MIGLANLGQTYEDQKHQRKANACYNEAAQLAEELGFLDKGKEYRSWIE